ncbi:MAG: FtsX-like permease family protein [Filifactoraceae bacterium]
MKRTLLKDSIREIKGTISRFLAILAIISLSVTFFTGIKISGSDMKYTGDVYLDKCNLMDFRLISTVGFDKEDIEAIKKLEGVEGVFPAYNIDTLIKYNKSKTAVVSVHSLTNKKYRSGKDYINIPMVIEGRLPEKFGEAAVEVDRLMNIKIGDIIHLGTKRDSEDLYGLRSKTMKVVGFVRSPLYISTVRGNSNIGNGKRESFIYVNEEEFNLPLYNEVYLTMEGGKILDTFGNDYKKKAKTLENSLKKLGEERVKVRYDSIVGNASEMYYKGQGDYNRVVIDSTTKIKEAEDKYEKGKRDFFDAKVRLAQSEEYIYEQEQLYNNEIFSALSTLETNERYINEQMNIIKDSIDKAKIGGYYSREGSALEYNYNVLFEKKLKLQKAREDIFERKADLERSISKGKEELRLSEEKLLKANEEIVFSEKNLLIGKKQVGDGLFEGNKKLIESFEEIKDIKEVKWYVLNRQKNIGFADYENAALRMEAIAKVFPLVFVFVGILICLTTIGRMVEEQRGYIGTLKALGYSSWQILSKYLLYAGSASLIGGLVGIWLGFNYFAKILFYAYKSLYLLPELEHLFDFPLAIYSLGVSICLTCLMAGIVCYEALRNNSAMLLRPKSPKVGASTGFEKIKFIWSRLKFTHKVTVRNLFRYKLRAGMTIIGVAGCSALLMVGFGLKEAITYGVYTQFNDILKYDISISIKSDEDEKERVIRELSKIKNIEEFTEVMTINLKIEGENDYEASFIVPKDMKEFKRYVKFRERKDVKDINLNNEGVIISEKLAKLLGLKVGEQIPVKIDDYDSYNLVVDDITENYIEHYIYGSDEFFKKVFIDEELKWNTLLVNLKDKNILSVEKASEAILDIDGVSTIQKAYEMKKMVNVEAVYWIVGILIVCAALLSFIVLYTLTNININQRIREIATIKVLGFYNNEAAAYIFRENIILSFMGALVGLVIGKYLCLFVIVTSEVEVMMFGREIGVFSFVASLIITMIFTVLVNLLMINRIRNINMVESLKAVE